MGNAIGRRLEALEARTGLSLEGQEQREGGVRREVLRRMSDDELDSYTEALERFEATGEFEGQDLPILRHVEELVEEVRGGAA